MNIENEQVPRKEQPVQQASYQNIRYNINELYSLISIQQSFINYFDQEIHLYFYLRENLEQTVFKKYKGKLGPIEFKSRIIGIDEEKPNKQLNEQEENNSFLDISNDTDAEKYNIVYIGKLQSMEKCEMFYEFVQPLESEDLSFKAVISKRITPLLKYTIKSKPGVITNIFEEFDNFPKVQIHSHTKLIRVFSNTHSLAATFSKDFKNCSITVIDQLPNVMSDTGSSHSNNNEIPFQRHHTDIHFLHNHNFYSDTQNTKLHGHDIIILFKNQNINKPTLYKEYNDELKLYSYNFKFLWCEDDTSKNHLAHQEFDMYPGGFIILLDQSCSMAGEPLMHVKEALKLFTRSLTKGSVIDIVGFGTGFKEYFKAPLPYTDESIKIANSVIDSLEANMGGTDIYTPLKHIYNHRKYDENLINNIFIITDGSLENQQICLPLIKENNSKFRVFIIGLGNEYESIKEDDFINQSTQLGKGFFRICKNPKDIRKILIQTLQYTLKPYINNIHCNFLPCLNGGKILYEYPQIHSKEDRTVTDDKIYSYSLVTNKMLDLKGSFSYEFYEPRENKSYSKELHINDILIDLSNPRSDKQVFNYINYSKSVDEISMVHNEEGECEIKHLEELCYVILGSILKDQDISQFQIQEDISLRYNLLSSFTTLPGMVIKGGNSKLMREDSIDEIKMRVEQLLKETHYVRKIGKLKSEMHVNRVLSNENALSTDSTSLNSLGKSNSLYQEKQNGFFRKLVNFLCCRTNPMVLFLPPKPHAKSGTDLNMSFEAKLSKFLPQDLHTPSIRQQIILEEKEDKNFISLICAQKVDGSFNVCENIVKEVCNFYKYQIKQLQTIYAVNSISNAWLKTNLITTLIILLYLSTKYSYKNNESCLLLKKGKQYLVNNNFDYSKMLKELNINTII